MKELCRLLILVLFVGVMPEALACVDICHTYLVLNSDRWELEELSSRGSQTTDCLSDNMDAGKDNMDAGKSVLEKLIKIINLCNKTCSERAAYCQGYVISDWFNDINSGRFRVYYFNKEYDVNINHSKIEEWEKAYQNGCYACCVCFKESQHQIRIKYDDVCKKIEKEKKSLSIIDAMEVIREFTTELNTDLQELLTGSDVYNITSNERQLLCPQGRNQTHRRARNAKCLIQ